MQRQVNYWRKSADKNFAAAKVLYKNKHYDSCLFFCHLAVEKMLKGLVVWETKNNAPHVHNLVVLASIANVALTDEQKNHFTIITNFNQAGRYDDEKLAFYKRCNKPYTEKYLKISNDLLLWLKERYPKK